MTTAATDHFVAEQYLSNDGLLDQFMPASQRFALKELIKGEEGEFFVQKVLELAKIIRDMPKTYETDFQQMKDKVVHLHYFGGSVDAWIVERDVGDSKYQAEIGPQHQAFGPITLCGESIGDSEWGYISIQELIDNGVELDLHWKPKMMKEIR